MIPPARRSCRGLNDVEHVGGGKQWACRTHESSIQDAATRIACGWDDEPALTHPRTPYGHARSG